MDALPTPNPLRIDAATQALGLASAFTMPADQVLHQLFRARRELGPLDRAFAAEVMYAVLRRWRTLNARASVPGPGGDAADASSFAVAPAANDVLGSAAGTGPRAPTPRRLVLVALTSVFGLSARALEGAIGRNDGEWLAATHAFDPATLSPAAALDIPDWLYARLCARFGETETAALVSALNQPAPLDLRVNTFKAKRDSVQAEFRAANIDALPTPYSPWGLRIEGKPALHKLEVFLRGDVEVQDEGSQLLALLTDAKRGEMVVDFCAGAGGKTLALGASMRNTGRLYAIIKFIIISININN
jgi:16S rRNA (cytosine967-C5)-methyltransferase